MKELVGKKIRLIKMVYHDPVAPGTTAAISEFDAVKNFRTMDIADFLNRINNTKEL